MRRALLLLLALGCGQTDECKRLEALAAEHDALLEDMKHRAEKHDIIEKRAKEAHDRAQGYMDSVGLDDAEEKIAKLLAERAAALAGAKLERHANADKPDNTGLLRRRSTLWTLEFPARGEAEAIETAWKLAESPPLLLVERIVRMGSGTTWRVDLMRATIDRVPIDPKPQKLPLPADPADIGTQFGFCGAGGLRSRIAEARAKIEAIRPKAEALSVLMPTSASWLGVERRSRLLYDLEMENRRLMVILLDASRAAKLRIVGVAADDPEIALEVEGGPKDRGRLEAALGPHVAELKALPASKGIIRVSLPNQKLRGNRREEPHGDEH